MDLNDYKPPLVAILRGLQPEEAPAIGHALLDAGFRLLEVPLNRPRALESIRALAGIVPADALVGGGTMLTSEDVDAVAAAGGRMFVAPHFDPDLVRAAHAAGLLCLPGVATPSEAFAALRAGAHGLKLFPAEAIGVAGLRALRTVLPPATHVFPVGGVRPEQVGEWVRAGATGFGIGSALYKPGVGADEVAVQARRYIEAWTAASAA